MEPHVYNKKITEVTPEIISLSQKLSKEPLLKPADVSSLIGVIGYLNKSNLRTYLFGEVVNNSREYSCIDVACFGSVIEICSGLYPLSILFPRTSSVNINGQYYKIIDSRKEERGVEEVKILNDLAIYRALLLPQQNFFGRLFRRKANIDLAFIIERD